MINSSVRGYSGAQKFTILEKFFHLQRRSPKVIVEWKKTYPLLHSVCAEVTNISVFLFSFHWWELVTWPLRDQEKCEVWEAPLLRHLFSRILSTLWKGAQVFSVSQPTLPQMLIPHTEHKGRGMEWIEEATNHVNHTRKPGLDVRQALICAGADVRALPCY